MIRTNSEHAHARVAGSSTARAVRRVFLITLVLNLGVAAAKAGYGILSGSIAGGGGVNLFNSQGNPWTADYLKITGELDVDLRSNIAAEARAKIVYERLINFCDDSGTKDALQFLMTREITHMKAFAAALESMKKPAFSIGKIAPTPGLVNQFFNDSTGTGDEGEIEREGQGGSVRHDPDSDGIGSTAGAAAGVVRAIFSDHRLQLQKGTILEVRLDRPLQVRWR